MRTKLLSTCIFAMLAYAAGAQNIGINAANNTPTTSIDRAGARALIAPFYHGVASGDPLSDRVILWTRVTTDSANVEVKWRIATDTTMLNPIDSGVVTTDGAVDFTVKVDVTGLQPNTFYYYEFEAYGIYSLRGRTKTLPVGTAVDSLRFAVVSCSNFAGGFFNGYNHIATRNDIDAVLHLGDYIYEYGDGEFGSARGLLPATEILSLSDYRTRHSHYKLDEDLIRVHQQYPFITVWDDHETANDAWYGGAANHTTATEGDWFTRKSVGVRSYYEWMPIRRPDPLDTNRIYRKFQFGNLIDLYMLDTRLQGREIQNGIDTSSARTLLGQAQFDWLANNLRTSPRRWQILGQQVMIAPVRIPQPTFPITYATFLEDQWDGYPAERQKLYDTLGTYGIDNFVVLTGDIHTAWGNDLPQPGYNSTSGAGSVGVEFVTSSVTSQNFPFPVSASIIRQFNPHTKYVDLTSHGYFILDVNQQRVQSDWYNLSTISSQTYTTAIGASWLCRNGEGYLRQVTSGISVANPARYPILAPLAPRQRMVVSVFENEEMQSVLLGAYPNPATHQLTLQYTLHKSNDVQVQLADLSGRIVYTDLVAAQGAGIHRQSIDVSALPAGSYVLLVRMGSKLQQRIITKL
jgi:alkaline phosphatase D